MVIDNVTTILLMTPIVIKLFECLGLNPEPVLPFIILNINIAGLATLIGHPPNMLITENTYVAQNQVTFLTYAMHMSIGVLLALLQTNIHLRIQCRNIHRLLLTNENSELKDIESNRSNNQSDESKPILTGKCNEKIGSNKIQQCSAEKKLFPTSIDQLKQMV